MTRFHVKIEGILAEAQLARRDRHNNLEEDHGGYVIRRHAQGLAKVNI